MDGHLTLDVGISERPWVTGWIRTEPAKEQMADELDDVKASLAGDGAAYRRIVERYQGHVSRILWYFTRDPDTHAELIQEAFVQAYLSLPGFKAKAGLGHWLATVATRVGYRYWRQTARQKARDAAQTGLSQQVSGPLEELTAAEAAELVHRLLARLPPRDRLVLTLRYLEGCSVEETSRRTGWTTTMVKVQTLRARRRLGLLLRSSQGQIP
ncbi:MAG: RNA polymerase sigma factor [Sedimentisphaerales bacterium]|nr:RNA polymerase sigma factor [Sedimentisphaerales bacterium]